MISSLGIGFGLGVLLSVPPGPTSFALMNRLSLGKRKILECLAAVLIADLIVIVCSFYLSKALQLERYSNYWKIAAGVFLILFSILQLNPRANRSVSPFRVTLLNPGSWICAFTLMNLQLSNASINFPFLLAFEVGIAAWYLSLLGILNQLSASAYARIQKYALSVIAITGVVILLRAY